ncbi:hypothetical protein IL306_010856 [Fusarium sp. DS 682]|nr:hypothetical protein IL306_010856 [Fusarium sp. DS 682]
MAHKLMTTQELSRRQPCLDFIETRLPEFHEAFANPEVRFNTSLGRYAPISQVTEGSNIMGQPTDHDLPELPPETTSSSTRRPFWEEMLPRAMEALRSTRDEPDKLVGTSNSIRAATGKAAKRTAKIREEIETSLRQFREKLEDVESIVAVYTNEDDIVSAALNVLVSILQAVEDIVAYYWANKGRKMAKALWRGEDYKTDLTECLDALNSSSTRLMEKANIGNFRETRSVNLKASEGLEKLKRLQLDHIRMVKEQRRLADAQSQMNESGRKMATEQQRLASGLSREASANTRNAAANEINAAANLANVTISAVALNAFDRLSQEYLTAISDISNAEEIDLDFISDSAALVNRRDQGRAEQLVGDTKFRQWVVKTCSTELLIHGHMRPSRTSVSPLSLFTASIVRSLRKVDRFRVIAFFCGQHTDLDDPLTGGTSLIKSLIAQLLYQHRFDDADLAHVAQEVNLSLLKRDAENIKELCQLFVVLVRRLHSDTTLFCVLDSVNVYEGEEYMQDMHVDKVLYEILSLTQDRKVKTHVKIMFTSPTDTNMISAGFQQKDILSMSGRLSVDKHFSDSRLSQNFKGALESK